ncbi:hypothetical protein MKW92_000512 [Papaver armeniacum]|nr:hypothetical protein MKW92_000512 [Papaver armeniacum]
MVVKCMPDFVPARSVQITRLLPKRVVLDYAKSVQACDSSSEAPCVASVSKMFAVAMKMLPHRGSNREIVYNYPDASGVAESDECFLFAGQKIYVPSALYDPSKGKEAVQKHLQEVELHPWKGMLLTYESLVITCATFSSTRNCWPSSITVFQPSYKDTIEGDESNFLDNLKVLTGSLDCVEKATPNGRCVVGVHLLDGSSDLLGEILDGKLGQVNNRSLATHVEENLILDNSPVLEDVDFEKFVETSSWLFMEAESLKSSVYLGSGPSGRIRAFHRCCTLKGKTTMEEDTLVDQPPLFSRKKFTPKVSKKSPPVIENPQSNEPLEVEKSCDPESYTLSFSDLGLADWATRTCKELGMKKPTQVQHHCIPRILAGQDVLGLAQTGSGKTAAFALPILNRLAENPYGVFALVITPIRELAYQLAEQFRALGASLHLRCAVIFGGMDMITQAQALMQRPHVVIATPGRIKDLLEQNPDILSVFSKTKKSYKHCSRFLQTRHTFTSSMRILRLLNLSNNSMFLFRKNVKDVYLLHVLSKMEEMGVRSAIIFVSTCRSCHLLSLLLEELDQPAVGLHSHKSQALRLSALHRFKSGQTPILLATDVASRALDIPTVDLVINYDIPRYAQDYVHRVGRTARAGRGGLAVSFVTQNDVDLIHEIESVVGRQLDKFECKENDVLAEITKVYKAKRVATLKMMDEGFDQKVEERKAQKLKTLSEKGLLKEKTKKRRRTKTASAEESK